GRSVGGDDIVEELDQPLGGLSTATGAVPRHLPAGSHRCEPCIQLARVTGAGTGVVVGYAREMILPVGAAQVSSLSLPMIDPTSPYALASSAESQKLRVVSSSIRDIGCPVSRAKI